MLARHVKLSRTSTQADVGTDFQNFTVNFTVYYTGVSLTFSPGGRGQLVFTGGQNVLN